MYENQGLYKAGFLIVVGGDHLFDEMCSFLDIRWNIIDMLGYKQFESCYSLVS